VTSPAAVFEFIERGNAEARPVCRTRRRLTMRVIFER
jgi:hypothetical protein